MEKILIVEDDFDIQELLQNFLQEAGYQTAVAKDGLEAVSMFSKEGFHLILLDIMLPKIDGFTVCELIRRQSQIPIIMLTALSGEEEQIRGLDLQVDDYITKPFHISVLESRIQAVLRRAAVSCMLVCGNIRMDKKRMQVWVGEESVPLTSLEYRLLQLLMENKGCILPRNRLLEKLWDVEGNFVNDNTLTVAMKRLREKLHHEPCITTVRGIGYRMEETE